MTIFEIQVAQSGTHDFFPKKVELKTMIIPDSTLVGSEGRHLMGNYYLESGNKFNFQKKLKLYLRKILSKIGRGNHDIFYA